MLSQMLSDLDKYRLKVQPLPFSSVSAVSVTERTIGVGNHRGTETRGGFAVIVWKGGRLDAVVRFQLWANQLDDVDTAVKKLGTSLEADRNILRSQGFLRLDLQTASLAEFNSTLNAWFQTVDYKVLYEFYSEDTDGAESLITRIPITINSEYGESTLVTGNMVRWDNQTAPTLVVQNFLSIGSLSALVFIPGTAPNGTVTLRRTDGSASPPTTYPTLADFLSAIAGQNPVTPHGQVIFPSLSDFLNAFPPPAPDTAVKLGDWNGDGMSDIYESRVLKISPAIQLSSATTKLEISYQNTAFNQVAVVYLRVLRE